jgi:hypothetical protein
MIDWLHGLPFVWLVVVVFGVCLGESFPRAPQARMRALVRRHIKEAVNAEWPAMAGQHATLTAVPAPLAEALDLALALEPHSEGQKVA